MLSKERGVSAVHKAFGIAYGRDEDHDKAGKALLPGRRLRFEHGQESHLLYAKRAPLKDALAQRPHFAICNHQYHTCK
jgi:hypothetical protein